MDVGGRRLTLVACLPLLIGAAGVGAASPSTTAGDACGSSRAAVATLQDPGAANIRSAPEPTTISTLRRLRPPGKLSSSRVPGVETTTFRVIARLLTAQSDRAGGVKLVVADPVTGGSMVMTLPSFACTSAADPTMRIKIANARKTFLALCGSPPRGFEQLRGQATITGVGFFGPRPDQPGEAPNRLRLAPVIGFSAVGCRSGPATGLYGVVRHGPVLPACTARAPCWKPAAGAELTFSAGGRVIARARSASDGSYRVELAPGVYAVHAEPPPGVLTRGLRPSTVRVTGKGANRVNFWFATAIRRPIP